MKYIWLLLISSLLLIGGCSKHLTETTAKVEKKNTTVQGPHTTTTSDALVGVWKLDKIEIPDMASKMSAYGSQAEKDKLTSTLALYQTSLQGLTVTFGKDGTYKSVYSGQSDLGTWTLNGQTEIRTTSKITSSMLLYTLVTIDDSSIKVIYTSDGVGLLMTFLKK